MVMYIYCSCGLTPWFCQVVLRFARKYIKNVEGAAATDLQVSLTGGSLIFRNFELNLEGAAIQAYRLGRVLLYPCQLKTL
jgi:hypothetical protein